VRQQRMPIDKGVPGRGGYRSEIDVVADDDAGGGGP
jgi:hypothetical protein